MNVKPKFVYYDIRRKQSVCLIMYTHENDVDTQVLEVSMIDNGEPIELSADYTYSTAIVNRDTKALINDNISCELNDSGNVLIPIDNFHTLGAQDLLIELTITDSTGDQVLVTPFPLWIHVNESILDDAQVTPESEGTVPELLEEAKEALENAGDYESLENKPQINGHELVGNKTGDELGLQGRLTAGENVTIDENGRISASGGVTSYTELSDKPQVKCFEFSADLLKSIEFSGQFDLSHPIIYEGGEAVTDEKRISVSLRPGNVYWPKVLNQSAESIVHMINVANDLPYAETPLAFPKQSIAYYFRQDDTPASPSGIHHYGLIATLIGGHTSNTISAETQLYLSIPSYILGDPKQLQFKPRLYVRYNYGTRGDSNPNPYSNNTNWFEVGASVTSAAINQNGTITFTMSDGSTVTTTGESVIGPQGPAGADGNDYVLTNQDKSDIADLVLAQLPTTQGVQYGN